MQASEKRSPENETPDVGVGDGKVPRKKKAKSKRLSEKKMQAILEKAVRAAGGASLTETLRCARYGEGRVHYDVFEKLKALPLPFDAASVRPNALFGHDPCPGTPKVLAYTTQGSDGVERKYVWREVDGALDAAGPLLSESPLVSVVAAALEQDAADKIREAQQNLTLPRRVAQVQLEEKAHASRMDAASKRLWRAISIGEGGSDSEACRSASVGDIRLSHALAPTSEQDASEASRALDTALDGEELRSIRALADLVSLRDICLSHSPASGAAAEATSLGVPASAAAKEKPSVLVHIGRSPGRALLQLHELLRPDDKSDAHSHVLRECKSVDEACGFRLCFALLSAPTDEARLVMARVALESLRPHARLGAVVCFLFLGRGSAGDVGSGSAATSSPSAASLSTEDCELERGRQLERLCGGNVHELASKGRVWMWRASPPHAPGV